MHFRPLLRTRNARLAAAVALVGLIAPTAAVADTPPLRLVNVVQVSWPGAAPMAATAASVANVVQNDSIARWRKLSGDRIVFTFDSVLPAISTTAAMPCDGPGSVAFLSKIALDAYTRAGISTWDDRYLIVVTPPVRSCIWSGRGVINPPGSTTGLLILNGTDDAYVVAHELGHNLGLGHSNLETCTGGRVDGAWADCSAIEYGSATDLMGNVDRDSALAAYHQWRLGLIPDSDVVNADRTVSVALQPVDTATGTRAVFVRDASAAYWIEYRQADPRNEISEGLVIYRTDAPPASSVVTPIDQPVDSIDIGLTTDVWMISLGNYTYVYPPHGSPSLTLGTRFTTAYGGATISARHVADGSVVVDVTRTGGRAPAAPVWTDQSTWANAGASAIRTDLDTGGTGIDHFEARLVADTGTSSTTFVAKAYSNVGRTALAPLGTGVGLLAADLPEGNYAMELRAISVAGVAGAWSTRKQLTVDHGVPVVTSAVEVTGVTATGAAALRWSGARDPGVGVCSARAYDANGFAALQWKSAKGGVPTVTVDRTSSRQYTAAVRDCFGNATWGALQLSTVWKPISSFTKVGRWSSAAGSTCSTGACTATVRTGEGNTVLIVGRGSGTIFVDGRRVQAIRTSSSSARRVGYSILGAHTVKVVGRALQVFGAQQVAATWTPTAGPTGEVPSDPTLADDDQADLAQYGFTNDDFLPGTSVAPMSGGTTITQATLDLCNAKFPSEAERQFRRQVIVSGSVAKPYLFLSTETVRYWSAQAAKRAIAEIDAAATLCKTTGYALTESGTKEPYAFAALPPLPSGLRPAADRRIYSVTMGEGESARSALLAYQFNGPVLSALYVVREGAGTLDTATQEQWLAVASIIASRLASVPK